MGETLAQLQELTWPFAGHYDGKTNSIQPFAVPYGDWVIARIYRNLTNSCKYNERTSPDDVLWVESLIARAQPAFTYPFQPCFVMQDYKENNVVAQCTQGQWRISGVFDFTHAHFGDGEADLARSIATYLDKDPHLVCEFIYGYRKHHPLRLGFAERFPIYMLDDRLAVWELLQKIGKVEWDEQLTLRAWISRYVSSYTLFS
jgi:aminoglycoside phosphotransferase (APT) family kinase protein